METCKKVTGLWTVTRNGPRILPSSYKWYTVMYIWTCWLRPRLPDSQERGRTTHWVYRGDGGGAGRPADRLRRSGDTHSIANRQILTGFHRYRFSKEIQWKKVAGLWTVTRNGPRILPSSRIWYTVMYISTCWLRPRLPDSQKRGRTTHWVYRGDGGGRCPPRARTRRLARHLCRQHRTESGIFLPENRRSDLLRKSNTNSGKSGRPVDSHEEWAGYPAPIPMVVTQTAHSGLLTPSRPLTSSGTRANDPLGIPRRWRRPLPTAGAHTAPGAPSLPPTSIGK